MVRLEAILGRSAMHKTPQQLAPCEWTAFQGVWYVRTPNGILTSLMNHTIITYSDGEITVIPDIKCDAGRDGLSWHGFLKNGSWREA